VEEGISVTQTLSQPGRCNHFQLAGLGVQLWRRASPHCVPQMPTAQISEPQHSVVTSQVPPICVQSPEQKPSALQISVRQHSALSTHASPTSSQRHPSGLGYSTSPLSQKIIPVVEPGGAPLSKLHTGWQLSPLRSRVGGRGHWPIAVSWGRSSISHEAPLLHTPEKRLPLTHVVGLSSRIYPGLHVNTQDSPLRSDAMNMRYYVCCAKLAKRQKA
jgi:hypothetical protein